MADIGTTLDFARNRSRYLTRREAAARIKKTERTIRRYLADGLPIYRILGDEYVHIDQLLERYRRAHLNQKTTRTKGTAA
jgi:hypothetical protein